MLLNDRMIRSCESNFVEDLTQEDDESNERSNHSSLDGVETTDESSDEKPPSSLSTTAGTSIKGKAMKWASKTGSNPNKKGTRRSAALGRPFKCDECEHSFRNKTYLNCHLRKTCGKERSFLCKQCDSRFKHKTHLQVHLIKIHEIGPSQLSEFGAGPKDLPVLPFKCGLCDRSYRHQQTLNAHLNKCGKDPTFSCTQCEYRSKWKENLQAHLINVHDIKRSMLALFEAGPNVRPVMPFKCDQCERTYKLKNSLQRHVVKKHSCK